METDWKTVDSERWCTQSWIIIIVVRDLDECLRIILLGWWQQSSSLNDRWLWLNHHGRHHYEKHKLIPPSYISRSTISCTAGSTSDLEDKNPNRKRSTANRISCTSEFHYCIISSNIISIFIFHLSYSFPTLLSENSKLNNPALYVHYINISYNQVQHQRKIDCLLLPGRCQSLIFSCITLYSTLYISMIPCRPIYSVPHLLVPLSQSIML